MPALWLARLRHMLAAQPVEGVVRLYARWGRFSDAHPYTAASLSAGSILVAADVTAQNLQGEAVLDTQRTLSLGMFGRQITFTNHIYASSFYSRDPPFSKWRRHT